MSCILPALPDPAFGPSMAESAFHAGELAVQARAGVLEQAGMAGGRNIRGAMPEQHRQFFAELPFMLLAGMDAAGQPWAGLRVGQPGFVTAPDAATLRIAGQGLPGDPLADAWRPGALLGGLGLQPATRRRNRVNGVIAAVDGDAAITLHVTQSFGNCPRYIQKRSPSFIERDPAAAAAPQERSAQLSEADRALLERADTFFIASACTAPEAGRARGADVSHRGGTPGFIRVDDAYTLTTPDFNGNRYFNTLGNLAQDARAGLLVIDYDSGDLLYIAADAQILWDEPALHEFPGAERLLRFHVREARRSRGVLPFAWSQVQYAAQFGAAPFPAR